MPKVLPNIFSAIGQVVAVGLILFVQYAFLTRVLGLERLGAWALAVSVTNAAQIAQGGLAATPVRFVSRYRSRGDLRMANQIAGTAVVSVALLMAIVLLLVYPGLAFLVDQTVEAPHSATVLQVLPLVMVGTWLTALAQVLQSCLDGWERIDLRVTGVIAGSALQLALVFVLVPGNGLHGMALAFVLGAALTTMVCLLLVWRFTPLLDLRREFVSVGAFREMLRYGVNLQLAGIAIVVFLPITKLMMARFGGLAFLGVFEIADRVNTQLRQLLANANRVLVPVISRESETDPARASFYFEKTYGILFLAAVPAYCAIVVLATTLSMLLIGGVSRTFVTLLAVIAAGCLVSVMSGPAYFSNLGTGHAGINARGHLVTSGLNLLLGLALGLSFGGIGVAISYALALACGGIFVGKGFMHLHGVDAFRLVPAGSAAIAWACAGIVALSLATWGTIPGMLPYVQVIGLAAIALLVLRHPNVLECARAIADAMPGGGNR